MMGSINAILVILLALLGTGTGHSFPFNHLGTYEYFRSTYNETNGNPMFESPPNMWQFETESFLHVIFSVIASTRDNMCQKFPDFSCASFTESTMDKNCAPHEEIIETFEPIPGKGIRRRLVNKTVITQILGRELYRGGFLCGIQQEQEWQMDSVVPKHIHFGFRGDRTDCENNGCYSFCLEKGKQPKCDPGYTVFAVNDVCIDENHDYYPRFQTVGSLGTSYTKEFVTNEMYEVQCCGHYRKDKNCDIFLEYVELRPQFECLAEDYNGMCLAQTDKLFWFALEYCGETQRRFFCCCESECYWTKCQTESEIESREMAHLEEVYGCPDINADLCEIYSKYVSFYEVKKHCLSLGPGPGFKPDIHSCNYRKYLANCELLGKSCEPLGFGNMKLHFQGIHTSTPSPLGQNAAGLKVLAPNNENYFKREDDLRQPAKKKRLLSRPSKEAPKLLGTGLLDWI